MADEKYYVIGDGKNLLEGMTKEQILAAIVEAVSTHEISDVDTGFVTKLKEANRNRPLSFWVGSTAEYNAIQTKAENCFYILSDDTEHEDLEAEISRLATAVNTISELKNNTLLDQSVSYGFITNPITFQGDHDISEYSIVKVTTSGAGEIICNVWRNTSHGANAYSITGTSCHSGSNKEDGVLLANINLECSDNALGANYSTYAFLRTDGGTGALNEVTITKITGVY